MTRKELVAASAEPLLLALLAEGESYGYALVADVRRRSGGRLAWAEGTLYPVLHRLERRGWVAARWRKSEQGRRRKYYRLQPEGRKALEHLRADWRIVNETLEAVWSPSAG